MKSPKTIPLTKGEFFGVINVYPGDELPELYIYKNEKRISTFKVPKEIRPMAIGLWICRTFFNYIREYNG